MSRLLLAWVFALMSVVGIAGVASAQEAANAPAATAQQTAVKPAPSVDAPQEPSPEERAETKRKLWIGGIAVLLFVLVYYRNKKRWTAWRKERAAKKK
ncbi:hypothetical protein SAMN05216188_101992 [Lentzea xinjiangensis]|uniref:MYXO-CTERM domain-containing protein n=1 Tax=Lentzea xinjiangensis TaxID=402600 RepID=A0A1H9C0H6_9PSEU|nr:hypothetical protein [Lentzea xinjiangensis]SEP94148.1 hypothetical protein SAMN05216188_101992 [Lentzea xinjiangensis]